MAGDQGFGIDPAKASYLANEVRSIHELGVEIGLIIGAGNIFRGMQAASKGMDRVTGDYLGMLATIMNAISVQDALEKVGCETRTLSAISVSQMAEPYIRRRAIRHLEKRRVVILAAGTGNPYFSTDTAAALRAMEINADIILKGTKVDGVYDSDPTLNPEARFREKVSYDEVLNQKLAIMDAAAISLCRDNNLPIIVFSLDDPGGFQTILSGKGTYTTVHA